MPKAARLVGKENVGTQVNRLRAALEAPTEANERIKVQVGVDGDEHIGILRHRLDPVVKRRDRTNASTALSRRLHGSPTEGRSLSPCVLIRRLIGSARQRRARMPVVRRSYRSFALIRPESNEFQVGECAGVGDRPPSVSRNDGSFYAVRDLLTCSAVPARQSMRARKARPEQQP